ncbi:MAG: hypothetical protein ABI577_09295 [bacterium]
MTEKVVSETVEFLGGPDDGIVLVAPPARIFEVRRAVGAGTVYCYEETGRVTIAGHREAAYRGQGSAVD